MQRMSKHFSMRLHGFFVFMIMKRRERMNRHSDAAGGDFEVHVKLVHKTRWFCRERLAFNTR